MSNDPVVQALRPYIMSRVDDNEKALLVGFTRRPSDAEMQAFHNYVCAHDAAWADPVAWMYDGVYPGSCGHKLSFIRKDGFTIPLYTAPPPADLSGLRGLVKRRRKIAKGYLEHNSLGFAAENEQFADELTAELDRIEWKEGK